MRGLSVRDPAHVQLKGQRQESNKKFKAIFALLGSVFEFRNPWKLYESILAAG